MDPYFLMESTPLDIPTQNNLKIALIQSNLGSAWNTYPKSSIHLKHIPIIKKLHFALI